MPRETASTAPDSALTPAAEACERFAGDLARIWPEEDARLGIAVSGGPDSTALLLLAAATLTGRIEAATVDHGLRPESAGEARAVARLCERLGVPHATLEVAVAQGNLQAEARTARYAALADWAEQRGLAVIATAHHADDQAETFLARLNRASGVAGLAGVRARGLAPDSEMAVLRPLLDWRRDELAQVVKGAGVEVAHDPANRDPRFDRARIRAALAGADWLDVEAIAASAGHLADADAALEWAARREWSECVTREGPGLAYRPRAPKAVALRVLARMAGELGEPDLRGSVIAGVFDALLSGRPASLGELVARPMGQKWTISPAPRRRVKT